MPAPNKNKLKIELAAWDGRSSSDVSDIYDRYQAYPELPLYCLSLLDDASLQKGASWLLKRSLEDGAVLASKSTAELYLYLALLEHWESKLHVLQSMPFLGIDEESSVLVERFLRQCLDDTNKFVRAWAYNGFYELAVQHLEYRQEAEQFFEMALRDEAPSVKARIRNIMKKGFY